MSPFLCAPKHIFVLQSVAIYDDILAKYPSYTACKIRKAGLARTRGNVTLAESIIREAIAQHKEEVVNNKSVSAEHTVASLCDLLLSLGSLQLLQGKDDAALQTFTTVVEKYVFCTCSFSCFSFFLFLLSQFPLIEIHLRDGALIPECVQI